MANSVPTSLRDLFIRYIPKVLISYTGKHICRKDFVFESIHGTILCNCQS